jgi:hypothetical protein
LAVLKKGLPRIRGVLVSTSMSRTTKSTVRRNPGLSSECPPLSPLGSRPIDPLAASTWL